MDTVRGARPPTTIKSRRGRPPLKRLPPQQSSSTEIHSIGNCRVEFPKSTGFDLAADGLHIKLSETLGNIHIKVVSEVPSSSSGFTFTLLNPKTVDGPDKELLQDVLKLYNQELPAMSYAANTGKESQFLENCILSGKYCTLALRNEQLELVGALTYQILPTDTNQAEIPLAAVVQLYHRKGLGTYLYKELQRRLVDVGVLSIFCWGDEESEPFWAKQGFFTVAEVDGRGKPLKLPIKADVRKAMSIPGSATLMISYLNSVPFQASSPPPPGHTSKDTSKGTNLGETCNKSSNETSPQRFLSLPQSAEKTMNKGSPCMPVTTPQVDGEKGKSNQPHTGTPVHVTGDAVSSVKNSGASLTPLNMEGMLSGVALVAPTVKTVSKPVASVAGTATQRAPLMDITNLSKASASRPPKKRPIGKGVQSKSAVQSDEDNLLASNTVTAINGTNKTRKGEEEKENQGHPIRGKPKLSTTAPKAELVRKRGRPPQATPSGVHEVPEIMAGKENLATVVAKSDKENVSKQGKKKESLGHLAQDKLKLPTSAPKPSLGRKRGRPPQAPPSGVNGLPGVAESDEEYVPQEGKEGKENEGHSSRDKLEFSTEVPKPKLRRTSGRPRQASTSKANEEPEENPEKENSAIVVSESDEEYVPKQAARGNNSGAKRGRENGALFSACGRRSIKRQKGDLLPEKMTGDTDSVKDQTNVDKEQSVNKTGDEDGVDIMINLLLPQRGKKTGKKITKSVKRPAEVKVAEPVSLAQATPASIHHPNDLSDGAGPTSFAIEVVPGSPEISGDQGNCIDLGSVPADGSKAGSPEKAPTEQGNAHKSGQLPSKVKPVIMFMNMANENQKKQLTKYVERLEGEVTSSGCQCTHVVTGEVRRTLNFCMAISSGAWILSPDWLKHSVKQKTFADEARFILKDRKFESKYKVSLEDVIQRAKERPNLLLKGMRVFSTPNIHPPVDTICQIVEAAGGQIFGGMDEAVQWEDKSRAMAVVCEEDMSQSLVLAKSGLRTFSSDWLLTCIVKQQLDLTAAQFTESL